MKTAKEVFDEKYEYYRNMENKPPIPLEARELIFQAMEQYHEARMKEELIDLVRLARKGSHVSFGNQTHWEFDIDRDRQVVDDYLTTRKQLTPPLQSQAIQ